MQIYIHIPFCVKKCLYCDFLSGPQNQGIIEKYVESLLDEIRMYNVYNALSPNGLREAISTVFVGGGTPSILSSLQIEKLFQTLNEHFVLDKNAEITIEVNPGTVTKEKLMVYRKSGINRISFGLQSANNEELKLLGRIHTYEMFLESYRMARECGFDNINVDLISAIPGQTLQSFKDTLEQVVELQPEHISAYSLIVEDGTPFAELYGEGRPKECDLPSEEEERLIYYKTEEILKNAGYHRYEISNYAKAGRESRHNMGYWERKEYIGFGLGAAGLVGETRYKNTEDLEFYIENAANPNKIKIEREVLTTTAQMEEYLFLGMRKTDGVSISKFTEIFGKSMETYYGKQIEKLQKQGLVEVEDDMLKLTKKGIDVSNYVFATFLS